MASTTGLTIEDFESLPAALARNHELVNGELVDVSGNNYEHNRLGLKLAGRLDRFVEERGLGKIVIEQEFQFGENAYGPDISFISSARVVDIQPTRRVQRFVPDLVIEIVSANDRFESLVTKIKRYLACGVKEAYLFSVVHREVYRFTEAGTQILREHDMFQPEQLPGFSIRIADLFALI